MSASTTARRVAQRGSLIVGLAILSWLSGGFRPASAVPPAGSNNMTFNICGYDLTHCEDIAAKTTIATKIADWVRDSPTRSGAILLQEVCSGPQFNTLSTRLSAYGYSGRFHASNTNLNQTNCATTGEAVFLLGGYDSAFISNYSSSAQAPQDALEERGYVCLNALFPDYIACGTHITAYSPYNATQHTEFRNVVVFFNGLGTPSFGGGDFNAATATLQGDPMSSLLVSWYNSFTEADNCNPTTNQCSVTYDGNDGINNNNRKIDFVFGLTGVYCRDRAEYTESWIPADYNSDHLLLVGYLTAC
jgi:hypothetical protein